ncbi:MAG: FAD-binding protein [Clostridia bacterium]|nr:FAD-binding protein [Clostridia bacterium]
MEFYSYGAVVVGSGCAGLAAACELKRAGVRVALLTEGMALGTSRNTGSDKQTYYKMSLAGSEPDSPRDMAADLFAGGAVDGDCALSEAALSVRAFMNLSSLGVPFPANGYGEYVGYKTDHDPRARATSAGPLTSKFMTEALERRARELGVEIFDGYRALSVIRSGGAAVGVLALDVGSGGLCAFRAPDTVLATGGPAGIYADSVYPECHTGCSSLAILAGAKMQNLTEWQFGLASLRPRWNVSGTYMQVIPRVFSVGDDGEEREFLSELSPDPYEAMGTLFLKGYQWPFDTDRADGSSAVDLLVYRETALRGRRVFLDYRKNPFGIEKPDFDRLPPEAGDYIRAAGAAFGTPIERLEKMNRPAVELYMSRGVDLGREPLRIALCAQHHNGGVAVDGRWRTSVPGLFAVGECAGTHGVRRPGGSALNSGQVGAIRAAEYIAGRGSAPCSDEAFYAAAENTAAPFLSLPDRVGDPVDADRVIAAARRRMSDSAGAIRNLAKMKEALRATEEDLGKIASAPFAGSGGISDFSRVYDTLVTGRAVLYAMIDYAGKIGASRGSALYTDEGGVLPGCREEIFRMRKEDVSARGSVQEVVFDGERFSASWRPVRPIPPEDGFFENVWRRYRENGNLDP